MKCLPVCIFQFRVISGSHVVTFFGYLSILKILWSLTVMFVSATSFQHFIFPMLSRFLLATSTGSTTSRVVAPVPVDQQHTTGLGTQHQHLLTTHISNTVTSQSSCSIENISFFSVKGYRNTAN
jgi:hypothetical protein